MNDNSGETGAGIYARRIFLSGSAEVNGNSLTIRDYGGGIFGWGRVGLSGSAQVNGNGGTGITSNGPVVLSGSAQVDDNTTAYPGGGVVVFQKYDPWTITLKDAAEVIDKRPWRTAGS